jgi:hypothetical protein
MNSYNGNMVDSELSSPDPRFIRDYATFMIERIDDSCSFCDNYNELFRNIKIKIMSDVNEDTTELTEDQLSALNDKYAIINLNDSIKEFKKKISEIYMKKNILYEKITYAKEKYNSFCEHIKSIINETLLVKKLNEPVSQLDESLVKLLNEKLVQYHKDMEISFLDENYKSICNEFYFLKETLQNLSSVTSPSICGICYETQVSWYINPCGHTLCDDCKETCCTDTRCPYCRTKKMKYSKLFF